MRVLVTGATGFTGGFLARTLTERGYNVRAFVRDLKNSPPLAEAGVEIYPGDLTDADALLRAASGCDVIYHIAAVYRETKHSDDYYRRVNVEGTRNVLDAAERTGAKRVVHCSTVGVHGDILQMPARESSPFAPADIYQSTKLEAELLVSERMRAGLPAVVFRPTAIYGPGDHRFLKLFKSIVNGTFRMIGAGDVYYHMNYVSDLVDGIILCGEHPDAVGQVYILGGRRYRRLREIVQMVAEVVGRPVPRGRIPLAPVMTAAIVCERLFKPLRLEPPLYPRRLDIFIKNRAFSIEKAQRELGYEPKVQMRDGFQRTFDWYRNSNWLAWSGFASNIAASLPL